MITLAIGFWPVEPEDRDEKYWENVQKEKQENERIRAKVLTAAWILVSLVILGVIKLCLVSWSEFEHSTAMLYIAVSMPIGAGLAFLLHGCVIGTLRNGTNTRHSNGKLRNMVKHYAAASTLLGVWVLYDLCYVSSAIQAGYPENIVNLFLTGAIIIAVASILVLLSCGALFAFGALIIAKASLQ